MAEKTKRIPVNELQEGDVLAENIGNYDNLRSGTTIIPSTLRQIQNLPELQSVLITDDSEEEAVSAEPENTSDQSSHQQTVDDYSDMISSRIENALSKKDNKTEASVENLDAIGAEKNIDLSAMDEADRSEAVKVLNFVDSALEDLENLESQPKIEKEPLYETMNARVKTVDTVYSGLLESRSDAVQVLEQIVGSFIDETGPNRDASILLKDITRQDTGLYLPNHCLNVAIVALATAIELTRLMEAKLSDSQMAKDMASLQQIRFKTFTRDELVKLGFAAFVHDLYFKKVFPGLSADTQLTSITDRSQVERHPAESYHIMKNFEMDYHVNKAVLQHHERVDGSGYPDGVNSRMFSKYTAIIAFADHYISMTQPNPFGKIIHPTSAIKRILTVEKNGFDRDVMIAFAKAATMVPIGSWAQLENEKIGYSSRRVEGENLPMIKLVMENSGTPLSEKTEVHPSYPGQRISKLLMEKDLRALNPEFHKLYLV